MFEIKNFYKEKLEWSILSIEALIKTHLDNKEDDRAEVLQKLLEKLKTLQNEFDSNDKFSSDNLSEFLLKTLIKLSYSYVESEDKNSALSLPENTLITGLGVYEYEAGNNIGINYQYEKDGEKKEFVIEVNKLMSKYTVNQEDSEKIVYMPFAYVVFWEEFFNANFS